MKLWQKVNNLTGNLTPSKNLVEYINMASKLLTSSLPEKFLWSIATEDEIKGWDTSGNYTLGTGSDIAYDKILAVYRNDGLDANGVNKKRVAAEAPDKNIHIFDESESLLGATALFPKFYKLSGKVYIKPDPDYNASDSTKYYSEATTSLSIVTTLTVSGTPPVYSATATIPASSFANINIGDIVVGYGIPKGTHVVSKHNSNPTFELSNLPTKAGAFTLKFYSGSAVLSEDGNKGVIVYAAPPVIDENTDSWLLAEFENVAIMYAGGMDMLYVSKTSRSNATTTLESVTSSLTSYISSFPSHLIGGIVTPTLEFSSIGVLETLTAEESGFTSDVFTMSGLNLPDPSDYIPSNDQILDYSNIEDALSKSQTLVDSSGAIGGDTVSTSAQGWLESEDVEMVDSSLKISQQELTRARGNLEKEKTKLEEFGSKVARGNQNFQAEIARWGGQVQKENSRIDNELKQMGANIEKLTFKSKEKKDKYASELQKVATQLQIERETNSQNVQKYSAEVAKEVQSYGMDLKKQERYLQEAQTQMQKAQGYLNISAQNSQDGMQYYNWAMNELKAITGGSAAPQQQQQAQRAEERKADQ